MRKSFLIVSLVLAACLMYLSSAHQAINPASHIGSYSSPSWSSAGDASAASR